ncbi:MAG: hypothetical protein ABI432_03320 [Flavobacteriales bacterium]
MRSALFALLFPVLITSSFAQSAQRLELSISGAAGQTVFLADYQGNRYFYNDTAVADANGLAVFDRKGGYRPGLYVVCLGAKRLEVILAEPLVRLATDASDLAGQVKVVESRENEIHHVLRKAAEAAPVEERDAALLALADENPGTLAGVLIRMSVDPRKVEVHRADGLLDSTATSNHYRDHFWDNTLLTDDRIARSPMFQNRFEELMAVGLPKDPLMVNIYLDDLITRTGDAKAVQDIIVNSSIDRYNTSPGMGATYVHMAQRYVCTGPNGTLVTTRQPMDKWIKVCADAVKKASLVTGGKSRDLVLCDTTEKHWVSLHAMPQACIVVAFWSPHCSHCKQAMPVLHDEYVKELRALDVGVYAVAEVRDSLLFTDWKAFIREQHLDWVNVGIPWHVYNAWTADPGKFVPGKTTTESMTYASTWEVNSTPQFYVLDKERRILAKPSTINEVLDAVRAYRAKQ